MEKSLEVIGQLQVEKQNTVRKVYAVKNLDEVYRRQTELNAMGVKEAKAPDYYVQYEI